MRPGRRTWGWRFAAAGAALLAVGCGSGGGGSSGSCRSFDELASAKPKDDDPRVAAGTQLATVTKVQGAAKDVAARLAPSVAPAYQSVKVGEKATWGVAVVQLADRARTLQVEFGDGAPPTTQTVGKGSAACLFRVTRSFPTARKAHPVRFTVVDPAIPAGGPSLDAVLDVA